MKFTIEGLSPVSQAKIDIAPLTIICGKNNTGKTRITNAIYNFYQYIRRSIDIPVKLDNSIFPYQLDLNDYIEAVIRQIKKMSEMFAKKQSIKRFSIDFTKSDICFSNDKSEFSLNVLDFLIRINKNGSVLNIRLDDNSFADVIKERPQIFNYIASQIVKSCFFTQLSRNTLFNNSFSIMSERTGLIYFRKHINLANALLASPFQELVYSRLPEKQKFERDSLKLDIDLSIFNALTLLQAVSDRQSDDNDEFRQQFIGDLNNLTEGKYSIQKDAFYFTPTKSPDVQLPLNTFSSSVKALMLLDYYVRYVLKRGDFVVIDEPELNLHPSKQRQLARFLSRLVNAGVFVFITTHSDYIIREFNILLMLNKKRAYLKNISNKYHYSESELLKPSLVNAYVAEKDANERITFTKAKVSTSEGITISTLNDVIDEMNNIQEEIYYGE